MQLLLDTHTLIWHRGGSDRLSALASRTIANPTNRIYISIVTLWEMSIKRSTGKLETSNSPIEYLETYQKQGAKLLPVAPEHVMAVELLPFHHRDPFDRMLIAQAKLEKLTLVTVDEKFAPYNVPTIW